MFGKRAREEPLGVLYHYQGNVLQYAVAGFGSLRWYPVGQAVYQVKYEAGSGALWMRPHTGQRWTLMNSDSWWDGWTTFASAAEAQRVCDYDNATFPPNTHFVPLQCTTCGRFFIAEESSLCAEQVRCLAHVA